MDKRKTERARELFRDYQIDRGMRCKGAQCFENRFAYVQNMYFNRESDCEGIESIPGYRKICAADDKIHSMAIWQLDGEKYIIFHSGEALYRLTVRDGRAEKIGSLSNQKSRIFVFDGLCLITDGQCLYSLSRENSISLIKDCESIAACSSAALLGGRLFLSAGSNIFYSEKLDGGDILFPESNLIRIGRDILSLITHGGRLWAFTTSDITCFDARDGFPVYLSIEGVNPLGQAASLGNEIIFLSREGLWAIENPLSSTRVRLCPKSEEIAPLLNSEMLYSAGLTVWQGYALISMGERVFLADSKSHYPDYDWYILSEIGGHLNDRQVFRYSDKADEGYNLHPKPHSRAKGEVISLITEDGRTIYFVPEGGRRYSVYPTEERFGGSLLPAEIMISDGQLLCFSAEEKIFLFNSGTPGKGLLNHNQSFYSFDGHAPTYAILTGYSSIGLPVSEKSSEGESLYLKIKAPKALPLTVTVNTDKGMAGCQTVKASPSENNCSCIIKIAERAHGWIEKQIGIEVKEFDSPFALCSMAYKYQVNKN